jgi:hypothetical protein|tara:strand:+ start:1188 stop:1499 length:312 start_codon:yes stop_codon:yes gene_type:complete
LGNHYPKSESVLTRKIAVESEDFILRLAEGRLEAGAASLANSCKALDSISEDFHAMLIAYCPQCQTGQGSCIVKAMENLAPTHYEGEVIEFTNFRNSRPLTQD